MTFRQLYALMISILSLVLISCAQNSSNGTELDPNNEPQQAEESVVKGKVYGKEWNYKSGFAALTKDKTMYVVTLYNVEVAAPCDMFSRFQETSVSFYTPVETGIYRGQGRTESIYMATFYQYDKGSNHNSSTNVVVSQTVSLSSYLSGKISAKHSDDNYINGTFEVAICSR